MAGSSPSKDMDLFFLCAPVANESVYYGLVPKETLNVVHLFKVNLLFSAYAQGRDFKK